MRLRVGICCNGGRQEGRAVSVSQPLTVACCCPVPYPCFSVRSCWCMPPTSPTRPARCATAASGAGRCTRSSLPRVSELQGVAGVVVEGWLDAGYGWLGGWLTGRVGGLPVGQDGARVVLCSGWESPWSMAASHCGRGGQAGRSQTLGGQQWDATARGRAAAALWCSNSWGFGSMASVNPTLPWPYQPCR